MTAYVNMGDKVNAGTSVSGAITLTHQQNIFTSDAVITPTPKVFTVTSALIDAFTCPVVSVMASSSDTTVLLEVAYGSLTPTTESLTNEAAASITPGTFTFSVVAITTTTGHAPNIGVSFL